MSLQQHPIIASGPPLKLLLDNSCAPISFLRNLVESPQSPHSSFKILPTEVLYPQYEIVFRLPRTLKDLNISLLTGTPKQRVILVDNAFRNGW